MFRGKVSEGMDFADNYARAVITVREVTPNQLGFFYIKVVAYFLLLNQLLIQQKVSCFIVDFRKSERLCWCFIKVFFFHACRLESPIPIQRMLR